MTSSNIFSKISKKLVWVLAFITIFCFAAFSISCGNNTSDKEPNYTYTDTNDGLLSNGSFSYGTSNLALTSYPKTSVTGWTRSYDTTVSYVNSGIVDVSEKGWKSLLTTLYKDNEFFVYTSNKYSYSKEQAKNEIINEKGQADYVPTNDEIAEWIVDKYLLPNFTNPSSHQGSTDSKVYMLNNYGRISAEIGVGTSQKITSSSTITLNKGEYGKFTVYIRTQNLDHPIQSNPNYGANIRVINKFNGTEQSEYKITNIISNDAWTQYTVYVKADDTYSCDVSLALGLGDGTRDLTEGTAYFDDVTFTHLTEEDFLSETTQSNLNTSLFAYSTSAKEAINVKNNEAGTQTYLYDMTLDAYLNSGLVGSYINDVTFDNTTVTSAYTTSNIVGQNGNKDNGASSAQIKEENGKKFVEADLVQSSYTITIKDTANFKVAPESYAYVEFDVLNKLSKFGSTTITVDVFDIYGTEIEKRATVASLTEVSDDWTKCGILIKNNFLSGQREFYINVVIGPSDVASTINLADYASGKVSISNPVIAKGLISQDEITAETELFSLFNSTANGATALYAGYASDFTQTDSTESYALTYSPSDIGVITHSPANSNVFTGVVSNHVYIKDSTNTELETAVNTRSGDGENGNFAGIVNTKYATEYLINHGFDLSNQLDYNAKKNLQPLMIYNKTADSYGFINRGNTIPANSFAKISVDVRVTGSANAYIYLTDISGTDKSVMTFNDFTVNTSSDKSSISEGTEIKGADLQMSFAVTADMMEDNGWLTVNFYVATGATAKDYRVELWNGSRDGVQSTGFVFFNNIVTGATFSAPTKASTAFIEAGNPLYEAGVGAFEKDNLIVYRQELTALEKQFNKEYSDKQVSYNSNFVWARNNSMIYADFRSVDPVEVDPYDSIEDNENASGCSSNADPSAFWMSFSSILLAAVLVFAIVMLVIKNIRRRRKSHASDAKSHYTVTSRIKTKKKQPKAKKVVEEITQEIPDEIVEESVESVEEIPEEPIEEPTEEVSSDEQTLDEYVYGEVQDFGETSETNENKED